MSDEKPRRGGWRKEAAGRAGKPMPAASLLERIEELSAAYERNKERYTPEEREQIIKATAAALRRMRKD